MNSPDAIVNALGVAYGITLVLAVFVRTPFTEAMRIDALFLKDYSEKTRPLNLLVGLLAAGYGLHSLFFR